jgi:AcrR family transcriptional regulator
MVDKMASEKKAPRKQRERKRHIGEIFKAAETVFAEKGFEGARMSDIARQAEFSVGYLYQIWEGKDDLYSSLVESKFHEFKKYVEEQIASSTEPLDQINALIDAHVDFINENNAFAKIVLVETSPAEMHIIRTVGTRFRRAHTNYLRIVEKIIANGAGRGVFVALPPWDLTLAIEGTVFSFAKDHFRNSPGKEFRSRSDAMKQILFRLLLARPSGTKKELRTR